jgi:hypothetical protein
VKTPNDGGRGRQTKAKYLSMKNKLLNFLIIFIGISTSIFSQKRDSNIIFPIEAKTKTDKIDTLSVTIGTAHFIIAPSGKLSWDGKRANSIQLKMKTIYTVEKAYIHTFKETLVIFYTESDGEDATSRVEKINLNTGKRIWKSEILGFNLGIPYIINNFAYVTTIGHIGKLNMTNGNYVYRFDGLYDYRKQSFNGFDTITFKKNLTFFISKNWYSKRIDSIIVNEKTGHKRIRK